MSAAKAAGIDAFALNIGVDSYTDTQLGYAYDSAAKNGMKVFISFDFNWYSINDAATIGQKIATYAAKDAQLYYQERPFVSSFAGDGLDVAAMKAASGLDVFFVPNFHPEQSDASSIDGALNWIVSFTSPDKGGNMATKLVKAWPNDGNNKAPKPGANVTVAEGDETYQSWLGEKPYLAREMTFSFLSVTFDILTISQLFRPGSLPISAR